jgi:putative ABC transport system permease protein
MLIKIALKNLTRQKTRTIAVLITVAMGITSLMIYHGFNTGIMNQYRENTIHARYGHGQINTKGYRDTIWEKPWEHWMEADHPALVEVGNSKLVQKIFPRISFYGLVNNGSRSISGLGEGVVGEIEAPFFNTINIIKGKNLSNEEEGIVMGKGLAEALGLGIGDRVTVLVNTVDGSLNGLDFYVTGIFHSGMKYFDDVFFKIQLDKAKSLLDTTKIEYAAIGLHKLEDWQTLANDVKKYPDLESTAFNVLDKVYYQNSVDFLQAQFNFILIVIFTIVVLGIFNTVSTIIMERKNEIGNLRANGESRGEIMILILTEGLLLGLIGTVAGVILAYLINFTLLSNGIEMPPGPGITRQFITHVELQAYFIFVCLFVGIISTLIGSFLAGRKVVKMPISDLLRNSQ